MSENIKATLAYLKTWNNEDFSCYCKLKENDIKDYIRTVEDVQNAVSSDIGTTKNANFDKQREILKCMRNDKSMIRAVLGNRPSYMIGMSDISAQAGEILRRRRFADVGHVTANERSSQAAIELLRERLCLVRRRVDHIQYLFIRRCEHLVRLDKTSKTLDHDAWRFKDPEQEARKRHLYYEIDKARLRYDSACQIRERYEALRDALKMEKRFHPKQLSHLKDLGTTAKKVKASILDMLNTSEKVEGESANELSDISFSMQQSRAAREEELRMKRKTAQEDLFNDTRKPIKRVPRAHVDTMEEMQRAREKFYGAVEEQAMRQRRILELQETSLHLKNVLKASETKHLVSRLLAIQQVKRRLMSYREQAMMKRGALWAEMRKLERREVELLFHDHPTQERNAELHGGMQEALAETKKRLKKSREKYNRVIWLLHDIKAGVKILQGKLRNVQGTEGMSTSAPPDSDVSAVLHDVEDRAAVLYFNVKPDLSMLATPTLTNNLTVYKLCLLDVPSGSLRVRVEESKSSDELTFRPVQDNEGFLTRTGVKQKAQEFVASKRQPHSNPVKKH